VPRVIVIGAGVAGLLAARELQSRGCEVTVLDKGHHPGGRLASRRIGEAVFDVGAQFFTTKGDRFAEHVAAWRTRGSAAEWFRGAPDDLIGEDEDQDGYPRFRGAPSMRSLAHHLADGLDVRLARRVTAVRADAGGWRVADVAREDPADTAERLADALLCTAPLPQSLTLLVEGDVVLSEGLRRELAGIAYAPTVAALVVPAQVPRLGARGALRLADGPVAFVSDNHAKGVSPVPAVTIHASEELSRRRWADGDDAIAAELLAAAAPWVGECAEVVGVHRWRYATPLTEPAGAVAPARLDVLPAPIAFAGDAFAGGRVEGAARSGLAAADLLGDALACPRQQAWGRG
jgi:renalase